jgi:hypothetical protein
MAFIFVLYSARSLYTFFLPHLISTAASARSSQAWLGNLVSNEFDLEDSCSTFDSFQDFFMDRRLDGETALELQRVGR